MIVIFVVVLVVFAEFRKASLDFKTAFEEEMRDLERQALLAERRKAAEASAASAATQPAQPENLPAPASAADISAQPQASEAPVIAPDGESVARGSEEAAENKAAPAAANLPESSEDSPHPA